jgi:hypothetical protein
VSKYHAVLSLEAAPWARMDRESNYNRSACYPTAFYQGVKLTYSTSCRPSQPCHTSLADWISCSHSSHPRASSVLRGLRICCRKTGNVSCIGDNGWSYHTLLRSDVGEPELELMDDSDGLRSASCFGAVGMLGIVLSPKTLCVWLEYF